MDQSYPYIASLTREPFLFYEMRATAKLMTEGLSDDAIVKEIGYSPEIPNWLTEYYFGRNSNSTEADIVSIIYDMYIGIFRTKNFKYLQEDDNISRLRNYVVPYIEF